MRYLAALSLLLALALGAPRAHADGDDQDRAREAYERHEILPLATILRGVERRYGRNVVNIEYEEEAGMPVYEFEIVDPSGQVIEVVVDARTGRTLGKEGEKD